jgi:hypothetical protein
MCHAGWNEKGGTQQTQESELKQGTIINISIPNMLTYQQSFSLLPRLNACIFYHQTSIDAQNTIYLPSYQVALMSAAAGSMTSI